MADLDPVLLDLPTPVYTNRLLLRPPKVGDGKLVNTAIKASFEELHKWMHWASQMPSIEESEIDVRKDMAQWILRKYFKFYAFVDEETFIGVVTIYEANWDVPAFELGYWGHSGYSGHGYMTETVAAATRYAFEFLKARRVEICCDPDNERSPKIPERLAYTFEGNLKFSEPKEDGSGVRDTLVFARYDLEGLPDLGFSTKRNKSGD